MRFLLLWALCWFSFAAFAASERSSVLRHPNGTSGSISNVSVTVLFYQYSSDGKRVSSLKMTWTEVTSTGALSGNRTGFTSSYPVTNWSAGTNITSSFSAWTSLFNASCAVEDPSNYGGLGVSGWSPLTGFAWSFAPPNDVSNWIWYTGHALDPEHPDAYPDAYTPSTPTNYWPVVPSTDALNSFTGTFSGSVPWAGSDASVVPVHCRAVRAFIRVAATATSLRQVNLVWDEYVNDETVQRYMLAFSVPKDGSAWIQQVSQPLLSGNGGVGMTGQTIGTAANSRIGNIASVALTDYMKPNSAGGGTFYDYRAAITRFLNAYTRDHGSPSGDPVYSALRDTSTLVYYPEQPSGALSYDYGGSSGVPLFDRCDGGTVTGSAPGSGSSAVLSPTDFTSSGLPSGAGSATPASGGTLPGNAGTTFAGLCGSWASFAPTSQTPATVTFAVHLPGHEDATSYSISSIPDTGTTWGTALNAVRLLFRSFCALLILWKFFDRVYGLLLRQ